MAGIEELHHVTAISGEPQVNIDFYAYSETGLVGNWDTKGLPSMQP